MDVIQFAGIDIGGANIKLATLNGTHRQIPFPIWKDKHQLAPVLNEIAESIDAATHLGVTMTAELADCFTDKRDGVEFIVNTVTKSFPHNQPRFYSTRGKFLDAAAAIKSWREVAASNWHALARLAFSSPSQRSGFVFDIGSTTTDIIPVNDGCPLIDCQDDYQRLANGQLLYAGVGRTPICSLVSEVELSGATVTIARELFATMADAFLWLGRVNPDANSLETADGRPATRQPAGQRLARMVCADAEALGSSKVDQISSQSQEALVDLVVGALSRVVHANPGIPRIFRTFGKGAWLAPDILNRVFKNDSRKPWQIIPFSADESVNQSAPALAVAKLYAEACQSSVPSPELGHASD